VEKGGQSVTSNQQILEQFKITKAQAVVLEHLMQGFSNAEIAERVYITEAAVKSILTVLYAKASVPSRPRLMVLMWDLGWGFKKPEVARRVVAAMKADVGNLPGGSK
jgi:DNA-binding NarL/FixJ family response regulator